MIKGQKLFKMKKLKSPKAEMKNSYKGDLNWHKKINKLRSESNRHPV